MLEIHLLLLDTICCSWFLLNSLVLDLETLPIINLLLSSLQMHLKEIHLILGWLALIFCPVTWSFLN
jgi:hypothetical protein